MSRGTAVPITPAVLRWAVEESGYTDELLADHLDVSVEDLASWKRGDTQPTRTPMRKLATKLHRQLATFLLPAPPTQSPLQVQFRSIGPQLSRRFSPTERRYLRRAGRQQDIIGWLSQELTEPPPDLPRYSLSDSPDAVGVRMREQLNIRFSQQEQWQSSSHAFDHWRDAIGGIGVTVFIYPLGEDSSGASGARRALRCWRMVCAGMPPTVATALRNNSEANDAAASQVRRAGRT